jgi:hypothetical protein
MYTLSTLEDAAYYLLNDVTDDRTLTESHPLPLPKDKEQEQANPRTNNQLIHRTIVLTSNHHIPPHNL